MLTALAARASESSSVWCSWMNSLARVMIGRLGVLLLHDDLVAQHREVLGKDAQQLDHGFVLPGGTTFVAKYAFFSAARSTSTPHPATSLAARSNCRGVGFLRNTCPVCR